MLDQSRANRELIRNLAHEIKNPLAGSAARPSFWSASSSVRICTNIRR